MDDRTGQLYTHEGDGVMDSMTDEQISGRLNAIRWSNCVGLGDTSFLLNLIDDLNVKIRQLERKAERMTKLELFSGSILESLRYNLMTGHLTTTNDQMFEAMLDSWSKQLNDQKSCSMASLEMAKEMV